MKRLTMLTALMALMMALAAIPAMAQTFFDPRFDPRFDNRFLDDRFFDGRFGDGVFFDNGLLDNGFLLDNGLLDNGFFANGTPSISQNVEPESGDVAINNRVSNTGNYASQCTPANQTGNTGNFTNSPAVEQVGGRSGFGGIEPEGVEVSFGGSVTADCPSTIQQSSSASG